MTGHFPDTTKMVGPRRIQRSRAKGSRLPEVLELEEMPADG